MADDKRDPDAPEPDAPEPDAPDDEPSDDAPSETSDVETPERPQRHRGLLAGRHASAAVIGVLTLLLGFAIAVQVHANSSSDSLSDLREDDLVSILDNQDNRATRLRIQISDLQASLRKLRSSGDRSSVARAEAKQEAAALGVLLGTLPAYGPGVDVTVTDPGNHLDGEDLLDVVEELRGAGAEAIEFAGVRVSTDTAFTGNAGAVRVAGTVVHAPYRVIAIGGPNTLDTALNIPGGIADTVQTAGGRLTVHEHRRVVITRTRALPRSGYVKPSH